LLDTRNNLAVALVNLGHPAEAEGLLRESVSAAVANYGTNHVFTANCINHLALVYEQENKLEQAEDNYRQGLAIERKVLAPDHAFIGASLLGLGGVLHNEGKMAEAAEVCRELLVFRRKRYGDHDDRVLQTVAMLADLFLVQTNEVQFGELAAEFPEAWVSRSEDAAQHGRWPEARAAAAKFLESSPADHQGYHLMAPLLVQNRETAAYEQLCEKITTLFAGATNPFTADRMAKDCLILPRPGADLKVPGELAETAVTRGRGDSQSLPYFQCCKALGEFRLGHYEQAVNWANFASQGPSPYSQAEAAAITAMSQFKLDQLGQARAALTDCSKVIAEKLPKSEEGHLGNDWRDWIIAHALQFEAKQLIDGKAPSAGPSANLPR
jgi:tetratricopeptide (TPR) repeat protein